MDPERLVSKKELLLFHWQPTGLHSTGSGVPAQAIVEFGGANQVSVTEKIQKPAKKGASEDAA